ncbi:MAG TPA: CPBP family intramembrane glutamic endopeptidase [Ktedonobacteraceae bacterium]|nr:CPBP family intramembrane glutamic endopeptidase [Ktedonobacteraceae bacterium]
METSTQSGEPLAPAFAQSARVDWRGIGLFLLLTFGISWGLWLGLRAMGVPFTIRAALGMFGPALGALLTRLIRREGWVDAGLGLRTRGQRGAGWMYLAAYVVPPVLIAASIGFVLLVGYEQWDLNQHLHTLADALQTRLGTRGLQGMSTTQLASISLIAQTVLAFTLGLPFNMIFTFGEEFGWRGYLLPRLAPLGGLPAAILVGLVWGFWHAPLIVLDGYNYPGHPWLGIVVMMLFTVLLSIIFAWLRFRSGSVWPSTLAHAAFNAQAGFGALVLSGGNSLLRAPIGLLGLVPMFCFALVLVVTGRVQPEAPVLPLARTNETN